MLAVGLSVGSIGDLQTSRPPKPRFANWWRCVSAKPMIAGRGGGAIGGVTSLATTTAGLAISAATKSVSAGMNRARRKPRTVIAVSLGEERLPYIPVAAINDNK